MPAASKRRTSPPPPEPSNEDRVQEEVSEEIPDVEKRQRTTKFKKLESAVEGIYIMLGGGLTTLPMVSNRTKYIGMSLARSSSEIAEAWIDLAEEDKRVLRVLEQFTSFSGWGKVIGVHFMAIGAGVPGIVGQPQQPPQGRPMPPAGANPDLQEAMQLADFLRQAASEVRQQPMQPNGAPTEQEIAEAAARQQPRQGDVRQARRPPQQWRSGRGAGMPSPADLLGAQPIVADSEAFPTSGPESVRG
jgi:hypothetical protein